jgi:predicted metal-binding membrane protein
VPVLLSSLVRPPWPWLFAAAGIGLALSAFRGAQAVLPAFCGTGPVRLLVGGSPEALESVLKFEPPVRLFWHWAVMLLAMMPPLLAVAVLHVWRSSLPRRRPRALTGFLLGYAGPWLAVGAPLIALSFLLRLVAGEGAFAAALLLALAWSASPWQRATLNRGHRLRRIGLFGRRADRDCLAFGLVQGGWCIASCWAWMLVPLAAGSLHAPAMAAAAAILLGERLALAARPRWRVPLPIAFVAAWPRSLLRRRQVRYA